MLSGRVIQSAACPPVAPLTLKLTGGSLSIGTGSSTFGSPVELTSGVKLNVATGASVLINTSQTIAVDAGAAMTVGAASVVLDNYNGGSYGINVAGTLTTTGTSFTTYRGNNYAAGDGITALTGGRIIANSATGTLFNWDSFNLNNGSILNPGDLVNDTFQTTVYAPGTDIPLLAGATLTANKSFQDVEILAGNLPSGTLTLGLMGSASTAKLRYVFPSGYEVKSGATLAVADGVSVFINTSQTIAVDAGAAMTVGAASVVLDNYNGGSYGINVAGTLTTTGTSFTTYRGNNYAAGDGITALTGGRIIANSATGTLFNWDSFNLNNGSILNPGDLVNDTFQTTVYAPGTDIPLLAGATLTANKSFQDVEILAGNLPSGTLTLGLMGSASTAKLRYVFPSGYEVKSGATLAVADGVSVFINTSQTIAVDAGAAMTVGAASVVLDNYNGGSYGINVAGTLTTTGTSFTTYRGNNYAAGDGITALTGGRIIANSATGTLFNWDSFNLNNGSILNPGDLVNDTFQTTVYAPGTDIPLLAGATLTANKSFQDVEILAGNLPSGTLTLGLMGSASTAKLRYVFPSGYEVKSGATLAVADGVSVFINTSQTIAVDAGAAMTVGAASVVLDNYNGGSYGINVAGTLTTTGTSFTTYRGNNYAAGDGITALTGGRIIANSATGTLFNWDSFNLNNGSILNPGDLVNDTFQTTVYAPGTDIPLLAGATLTANKSFQDVEILAGNLPSGTLTLGLMGSASTAKLRYVFPSGYEVKSGATLAVADGVSVFINTSQTIAVDAGAAMTVGAASVVLDNYNGGSYGINVAGTLTTTGTSFTTYRGNNYAAGDGITALTGGHLTATDVTFRWDNLTLLAGSKDVLHGDIVSSIFTINSGANPIAITGNDFSLLVSSATPSQRGLQAVGVPTDTIDLTGNYWGTTTPGQIALKINDHNSPDSTRPTVKYDPWATSSPSSIVGKVFVDTNGDGVQDNGEQGIPGVTVYIDANNNGVFDAGEISTVTQAADPNNPGAAGTFRFDGLQPGNYTIREVVPNGSVETAPAANASATVYFSNSGSEAGITKPGATSFTVGIASFSGGAVFVPTSSALLASSTQAYNCTVNPLAEIDFSNPVNSVTFFYVHNTSYAAGTATAYAADGTVVGTAASKAATTMGDPANFVTITGSKSIAKILFTGGVVDDFTSVTSKTDQAYYVSLPAGQTINTSSFGDQYIPAALEVNSLTPTPSGFTATFASPLSQSVLNLYDSGGVYGPADATLVGKTTGLVRGSMLVSADGKTVTFIKTGGILAPDSYTVTLVSGANAFVSTTGALLDGNGDGVPGDNLVQTFTVNPLPSNAVVVSLPDFARGYGQPVNLPASSLTAGLPITLSTGQNVTAVDFTLTYDPTLLTITDNSLTTTISGASAYLHVVTPGTAQITVSSATAFNSAAGAITLGSFTAVVPNNAPYASKELLHISNLQVWDNSPGTPQLLPSVADDGFHVAAFFGDLNGDQKYSGPDVVLEQRVIGLYNTGSAAYRMADPVILGDITLNGRIEGADTTSIQREIGLINVPNIPSLPNVATPPPTGPDPEIYIPKVSGNAGDTVSVPIRIKVTEANGIDAAGFTLVIGYDPSKFTVSSTATIGGTFAALGTPSVLLPPAVPGVIIVQASTGNPAGTGVIANGTDTVLVTLSFTVAANAPNGPSVLNLMQDASNQGQDTFTEIYDTNLSDFTLSPAPTNAPNDPVDGIFQIGVVTLSSIAIAPRRSKRCQGYDGAVRGHGHLQRWHDGGPDEPGDLGVGDPTVATISNASGSQGLATTLATGTSVITASLDGVPSTGDTLTVTPPVLTSIALTPANPSIAYGLTEQFTATGTYSDGTTANVTSQVTWASATATVATISNASGSQGLATTLAAGTSVITASLDGLTSSGDTFTVTPAATATAAASARRRSTSERQNVNLNATVTSKAGIVNEGQETFTILSGTTVIGTPVTVNVSAGAAAAVYALPAGLGGGTYIIEAVFDGTANFLSFTDKSQTLVISAAASATAATSASATFNVGRRMSTSMPRSPARRAL